MQRFMQGTADQQVRRRIVVAQEFGKGVGHWFPFTSEGAFD